jgi:hypothetical protein
VVASGWMQQNITTTTEENGFIVTYQGEQKEKR